jgi:hypothetical protein
MAYIIDVEQAIRDDAREEFAAAIDRACDAHTPYGLRQGPGIFTFAEASLECVCGARVLVRDWSGHLRKAMSEAIRD